MFPILKTKKEIQEMKEQGLKLLVVVTESQKVL